MKCDNCLNELDYIGSREENGKEFMFYYCQKCGADYKIDEKFIVKTTIKIVS